MHEQSIRRFVGWLPAEVAQDGRQNLASEMQALYVPRRLETSVHHATAVFAAENAGKHDAA